jgi:lipopolysaccharide transport system permease protein
MLGFTKQDVRLAFNIFKMNVRDRYLGSSLGSFWAVANPLFMLAIFTFVFGFVFKIRLPGAETTLGYVIWLIVGYGPWIATTEAITATTNSVTGAAGVVKNLAFKTELLPISAAFVGLISLGVSLFFLLILLIVDGRTPGWHVLWLPFIIFQQFFLIVSLGLWLAAINVFVRDLSLVLPNMLMIVMFATPIFYPIETVPAVVQKLSFANPFFQISDAYRAVILHDTDPGLLGLGYVFVLSVAIFLMGLTAFRRAKGYFDSAL